MELDRIALSIGGLIKKGKSSALLGIYKIEVDSQGGDFLTNLLHTTANKIRYVKEPAGRDVWQSVEETLIKTQGDCEDFTILIGAMLLLNNYPVLLKFTASGDDFNHITPLTWDGEKWVVLDATLSNIGLDREGSYTKSVIYTVSGVPIGEAQAFMSGWLGWFVLAAVVVIILLRAARGG